MKSRFTCAAAAVAVALAGCSSTTKYSPPIHTPSMQAYSVRLPLNKDDAWAQAVPRLSKRFFVINNIDKASGLVNVSYSGDPEKYVDCGTINSRYSTMQGDRVFDFPASRGNQRLTLMHPMKGLVEIDRAMELDGRMNLVFEGQGPNETLVTANAKYILTKTLRAPMHGAVSRDTVSFNSGGSAAFPANDDGLNSRCVATGAFEREVLRALE